MVAGIESVASLHQPVHAAVAAPVLTDGAEIRESTRKVGALEGGLLLIAPHDVPLGVAEVRVLFGAPVFRQIGREAGEFCIR